MYPITHNGLDNTIRKVRKSNRRITSRVMLTGKRFQIGLIPLPASFRMHSTSLFIPSSLSITASIPSAEGTDLPNNSAYRVNTTIRTLGIKLLKAQAVSTPSIPGIDKSKSTKSGWNVVAFAIASVPSIASPHTENPECLSSPARIALRTAG